MKIITNSVKALLTASSLNMPCILIGGEYYEQDMCFVGSIAERYAKELNVDIMFFTTAAYSEDGVISDFDGKQLAIRKNRHPSYEECRFLGVLPENKPH